MSDSVSTIYIQNRIKIGVEITTYLNSNYKRINIYVALEFFYADGS